MSDNVFHMNYMRLVVLHIEVCFVNTEELRYLLKKEALLQATLVHLILPALPSLYILLNHYVGHTVTEGSFSSKDVPRRFAFMKWN